jgi:hypothetical protein
MTSDLLCTAISAPLFSHPHETGVVKVITRLRPWDNLLHPRLNWQPIAAKENEIFVARASPGGDRALKECGISSIKDLWASTRVEEWTFRGQTFRACPPGRQRPSAASDEAST